MDPNVLLAKEFAPVFAMLALGLPLVGMFVAKWYFGLRKKELELEAQLHGRELEARLKGLEMRQAAVEKALSSIAVMPRTELMQAPPDESLPPGPHGVRERE
jgi:hypothetical protein